MEKGKKKQANPISCVHASQQTCWKREQISEIIIPPSSRMIIHNRTARKISLKSHGRRALIWEERSGRFSKPEGKRALPPDASAARRADLTAVLPLQAPENGAAFTSGEQNHFETKVGTRVHAGFCLQCKINWGAVAPLAQTFPTLDGVRSSI